MGAGTRQTRHKRPDHFLRTRICPLLVEWKPGAESVDTLRMRINERASQYREEYAVYYKDWPPPNRRSSAIPILRSSSFLVSACSASARTRKKLASPLSSHQRYSRDGRRQRARRRRGRAPLSAGRYPESCSSSSATKTTWRCPGPSLSHRILGARRSETPAYAAEAEFSAKFSSWLAAAAASGAKWLCCWPAKELTLCRGHERRSRRGRLERSRRPLYRRCRSHVSLNIGLSDSIDAAVRHAVLHFGGIDGIVNTAAIFPVGSGDKGQLTEAQWNTTFLVNVTGNYLLAREAGWVLRDQKLPASLVLTSSANAVVPKSGSEAYDISKPRSTTLSANSRSAWARSSVSTASPLLPSLPVPPCFRAIASCSP